ncbi:MAG: NAD(P)-binding domain-containing protein [Ginsengibacter sp.]
MVVKKTIAIIGATEIKGMEIAFRIADNGYSLLLISKNTQELSHLSESIAARNPAGEINVLECVKDGCWEADVIIVAVACSEEKLVAQMMKEVATQKIVVSISDERNLHEELQQILPYSRLVNISFYLDSKEIIINGLDDEANEEISEIFSSNYHK